MDKPVAKIFIPSAMAVALLVVLRAQNQSPSNPPAAEDAPVRPARQVVRPRPVVPPPASTTAAPAAALEVSAPAAASASAPQEEGEEEVDEEEIAEEPAAVQPPLVETPAPPPSPAAPSATGNAEAPPPPPPPPGVPPRRPAPGAASSAGPGTPATLPAAANAPAGAPSSGSSSVVTTRPEPAADGEVPEIEFVESTMDISDILDKYEAFTGRSTMRSAAVQGAQLPLRSNGPMTRSQAARYIKDFLLLNGFSIVPSSIEGVDKVVPTAINPQLEQGINSHPIYSRPEDLPEDEQIVNYVLYFSHIGAEEAQRTLQTIIPPTKQGVSRITPVPSAGALILTDNVPAIRAAIAIKERIDVPPASVVKKFFQLERADAEEVAGVLTEILQAQSKLRNQQTGSSRGVPPAAAAQQLQPGGLPPGAIPNAPGGQPQGEGGGALPPDESTVVVKAITRTNEVLISGRPSDLLYLEDLITELDKKANVKNLKRFPLRFIRVEDFLQVAQDAISRGQEVITTGGGGGGPVPGVGAAGGPRLGGGGGGFGQAGSFNTANNVRSAATRSRTRTTATAGGGGIGGGGLASGRSTSSAGTADLVPSSVIVGKTLLIAEPRSNTLLVAGPPEHLERIEEVLREMDRKPWQVSISAVIAEVSLSDDMEYGIDLVRRVQADWAGSFITNGSAQAIIDPGSLNTLEGFKDVGSGLSVYGAFGEFFNTYIRALESTGRVQVISRPFIFTANNKEATISIGRRVPVPASSQSSVVTGNTTTFNTNIEYEDVNLGLTIVPLINSRDEITLNIYQNKDDVLNYINVGTQSAPEISQQELETEISVPNGGIAVIGGSIQEKDNANHRGLPWLTRVPILRNLVGNTGKTQTRSELLIFIQPRIVATSEELESMHTDHVRRTVIGKEAELFAQPPYNTSDVKLPTEEGDIPLNEAGSPQRARSSEPAFRNERRSAQPLNHYDGSIPQEKRRPAFWKKELEKSDAPAASEAATESKKRPNRFLPWNWGKKSQP